MSDINHILELIRNKRKSKGLTQAHLAEHLGISQSAYKDIELGKTDLKIKTLQDITNYLDIVINISIAQDEKIATTPNFLDEIHTIKTNQDDLANKIDKLLILFNLIKP